MKQRRRVVQVGLGPIGIGTVKMAAERRDVAVVGAVDIRRELEGRQVSDVAGAMSAGSVVASVTTALERFRPDVALVTTVSELAGVVEECEILLRAGCSVVSTCEEMVYPLHTRPDLVARLDAAGKAGRAACLGVGINPGFVLDFLPIALTAPVARVTAVRAFRVVDAAKRRGPLQKKVGAGLTRAEFAAKVEAGGFGHRGMLESLHLLCDGFGVPVPGAFTTIEPVIAERRIETDVVAVEPGRVAGIHQTAASADARVKLDLKMYVGAADPGDRVEIDGTPEVRCHVEGGYHGDVATCAITLNAIDAVLGAAPGFHTMLDVAVPRAPIA